MSITPNEVFQIVFGLVGSIISLLLLGNLFFLKKLVQKVDVIDTRVQRIRIEVVKLKVKIFGVRRREDGNGEDLDDDDDEEELLT